MYSFTKLKHNMQRLSQWPCTFYLLIFVKPNILFIGQNKKKFENWQFYVKLIGVSYRGRIPTWRFSAEMHLQIISPTLNLMYIYYNAAGFIEDADNGEDERRGIVERMGLLSNPGASATTPFIRMAKIPPHLPFYTIFIIVLHSVDSHISKCANIFFYYL